MKKILLTLFAALFALNVAAQENKNGTCGSNVTWTVYPNYSNYTAKLVISGSGAMSNYSHLEGNRAPWYKQDGFTIWAAVATEIEIGDQITHIGDYCFYNMTNLKTVTFVGNSSCSSIGDNAFYNCTSLTTINVPESVTDFGTQVFSGCPKSTSTCKHIIIKADKQTEDTYTIPEEVKYIEQGAFDDCNNMKYLVYKGCPNAGGHIITADWRDDIITTAVPSDKIGLFTGYHGPNINVTTVKLDTDSRFKSYAFLHDVKIPENITAYTATTDGEVVTLKSITNRLIQAGEGVFLKAKKGYAGTFTFTNGKDAQKVNDNMLVGVTEETILTSSDYAYVMQTRDGVQKFYQVIDPLTLARFKAYLKLEGNNANMFSIFDFDENTTDIEETEENEDCSANSRTEVYNMAGQKLSAPQKGLNIINGKIVIN